MVKMMIGKVRITPRDSLLQNKPKENDTAGVTSSSQLKPVQHIINELQPMLDYDTSLKQTL